jgi:hypothetical protein
MVLDALADDLAWYHQEHEVVQVMVRLLDFVCVAKAGSPLNYLNPYVLVDETHRWLVSRFTVNAFVILTFLFWIIIYAKMNKLEEVLKEFCRITFLKETVWPIFSINLSIVIFKQLHPQLSNVNHRCYATLGFKYIGKDFAQCIYNFMLSSDNLAFFLIEFNNTVFERWHMPHNLQDRVDVAVVLTVGIFNLEFTYILVVAG